MYPSRTLFVVASITLSMACSKETPKPEPAPVATPKPTATQTAAAVKYVSTDEARKAFVARCASCHGMEGKGNGPGSTALNPKPRNYTDKEWQKTVTDEQIAKTIQYGGAAVGKSPIMPAQPDLASKPELLEALVRVVRAFGQ